MTTIPGATRLLLTQADETPFNERVFVDGAPAKPTFPYVTLFDGVSIGSALEGDAGDTRILAREIQADLWQRAADESETLPGWVYRALHGQALPNDPPGVKTRLRVRDVQRFYEEDTHIVHHAFTLVVRHDPTGL